MSQPYSASRQILELGVRCPVETSSYHFFFKINYLLVVTFAGKLLVLFWHNTKG